MSRDAAPSLDVAIVGGGPAGLATAIGLRLAGLSVRVFDRRRPPIDKACGEGLMPDAVLSLRALGVQLGGAAGGRRLRGIRYVDGDVVAEGELPAPGGLGLRRLDLHRALVDRAAAVGVELSWGTVVTGLTAEGLTVDRVPAPIAVDPCCDARSSGVPVAPAHNLEPGGVPIAARWVVGADGLHSRVRRWAGLEGPAERWRRFGVRRHYACAPWSEDLVEVHWGDGCEAYVTPVAPGEVGVAMLWSDAKATFDTLLARFPALAARLAGAVHSSRDRGAGPLRQRPRAVCRGRVALVGDAGGYFDAITGEGLAVACHQAAALAAALAGGGRHPLRAYAAAHRRIGRLPDAVTGLMLALERRPALRRRAMRALAADPALFSRLLGIHARAAPPRDLGIDGALRLVYRLMTA